MPMRNEVSTWWLYSPACDSWMTERNQPKNMPSKPITPTVRTVLPKPASPGSALSQWPAPNMKMNKTTAATIGQKLLTGTK